MCILYHLLHLTQQVYEPRDIKKKVNNKFSNKLQFNLARDVTPEISSTIFPTQTHRLAARKMWENQRNPRIHMISFT